MERMTIPIKGMHCKSCTILVTDAIYKVPGVKHVSVNFKKRSATISYAKKPNQALLEKAVEKVGYTIAFEDKAFFNKDVSTYTQLLFNFAILAALLFLFANSSLFNINFNTLSSNNGIMALVVGLTAGFSTCMALVGGLIFGLSARFAEKHPESTPSQKFNPHLFFNIGRILAFFILGGIIGVFGSFFKINSSITGLMTIIIGFVMIILGLQLTEIFPRLSSKTITLPTGLAKRLGLNKHQNNEYSHKSAMILGALSFFLPCGFTQAMQLVAISSGNFVTGSLVMGLFAIGTAPGLLSVGGLTALIKGKIGTYFFRFAGALVIALAAYNIWNGLTLTGFRFSLGYKPNASFNSNEKPTIIKTTFTVAGDIPQKSFTVKAGKPYILEIDAKEDGQGCMSTIMIPGVYDTPVLIKKGKNELAFIVNQPGTYQIACAMGIVRGTLTAN